jgi:hypothetical protein
MVSDVLRFSWEVSADGYDWVHPQQRPGREPPEDAGWELRDLLFHRRKRYEPMKEEAGLFSTFADLPRNDRGAILKFANRFGLLGTFRTAGWDRQPYYRETWTEWAHRIDWMRQAVRLWDMVRNSDGAGLSKFIRRREQSESGEAGWYYDSHPGVADTPCHKEPYTRFFRFRIDPVPLPLGQESVVAVAGFQVQRWINLHLADVSPYLVYDPRRGKRELRLFPQNLLVAMWLQFAQAIDGDRQLRACKACGKWFVLSHKQADGRTARREFCGGPCKSKDYRRRRERALELSAQGAGARQISQELDTSVQTVKAWLKRKGK